MNVPLECRYRTHGICNGDIVAILCKDYSRLQSGRTVRVHVYHRWRITPAGPETLPDIEVLAGTPFEEIDVTHNP